LQIDKQIYYHIKFIITSNKKGIASLNTNI